jgi:hypothetical protein
VKKALALTFEDSQGAVLRGRRLSVRDYVEVQRAYFHTVPEEAFWRAVEEFSAMRPWYRALLDASPEDLRAPSQTGGGESQRSVWLPIDAAVPRELLVQGWSAPEGELVWSDGVQSVLSLDVPAGAQGPLTIELHAGAYLPPNATAQHVIASVDGEVLAEWAVRQGVWIAYRVVVPVRLVRPGRALQLRLDIPGAASPPGEARLFGMALQALVIRY